MELDSVLIASVVGAVLSVFTSVIKRFITLSRFWNYVLAFGVSILAVVGWDLVQNGWEGWTVDFASKIAVVFTVTQLVYGLVIKELDVDTKIEGVEAK